MTGLRSFGAQFFRGTVSAGVLKRCRIEPRQYWILIDLFETLSNRQELVRMGSRDQSLRSLMLIWFLLSSLISLVLAFSGVSPGVYLLVFSDSPFFNSALSWSPRLLRAW